MSDILQLWFDAVEWWPVYSVMLADGDRPLYLGDLGDVPAETARRWLKAHADFAEAQDEIREWIGLRSRT